MTAPNEKADEMPRPLFSNRTDAPEEPDQAYGDAFAAYQKVEALFDLLRRPATATEARAADNLAPGKLLGEFAILRPLASGGMGQVFLARQESLGRLVALKVCKPEIARDPRMKSRFLAEALALAKLAHPNVVPVLSTGEDHGYLYLAMEYVAGPTLAQVLQAIENAPPDSLASNVVARVLASPDRDDQSLPWGAGHAKLDRAYQTWAVQTLQQVAQGLAAAHAAGILHRDIKPANIVFAANGVPKIVDFGLARTTQAPSTTVAGEFFGTPAYTSPEQARGDVEAVSPASDVFSFGVTLFETLSLNRPFPGRTSADVLSAVLNSDAPLLRHVEKRLPWELEAITDKCLRKNPKERYSSSQALADDLRNYLELRPISARPTSKLSRAGRMIRRRPWVAAFFVAFVSAALLGAFLGKYAWAEHSAQKEAEKVLKAKAKASTFARQVDEGDAALFRCLTGQRPTWLTAVIEQFRQKGIIAYSTALEIDPNAVWPLVQRARLYASKKETLDLASADLDRARELRPAFGSIRKFQGFVLDELGLTEEGRAMREESKNFYPTAAEDLYWLGVIAHSKEEDDIASYAYFSKALLLAPNDYWSRLERAMYGRVLAEKDARQRVLPELDIAKLLRPDLPFASEYIAPWYWRDPLRAKKELEDQIERFGLDVLRAHGVADLLQQAGDYDAAEKLLRNVLDQDTGGETAGKIGDLNYRKGDFEQARDWYIRAVRDGTRHPQICLRLANALTAMKDWKGAEKAYLDGIAEHPREAYLYWNLGTWYEARGRMADAESIYRKGCGLPIDVQGSPGSSRQFANVEACYRNFAFLLRRLARQAESVQVLERGITRLENALPTKASEAQKAQLLQYHISLLKENLGQGYIINGRQKDAVSLVNAELEKRPITLERARVLVNLYGLLGMQQAALEVGRLAEFTIHQSNPSSDVSQTIGSIVNGQLQKMGLYKELFDRLESKRALGEAMSVDEYGWFIFHQGAEAVTILGEGVKNFPDSALLQTHYMQLLANAGRKDEAWKAYERGRDCYFAQVDRSQVPALPFAHQPIELLPLPPVALALPWYKFLMQEGNEDELRRLEERLQKACPKTKTDPKDLLLPRAFAEYGLGRHGAAAKSLEACLELKVWNNFASEALITGSLARSLRALGRREDAIKSYRRAVQVLGVDPSFLSEFLCLVVEEQGVQGLLRELSTIDQSRLGLDVRLNATFGAFNSWVFLAAGDEKAAFEYLVQAVPNFLLASQQTVFIGGDEGLVCGAILQTVSEKLADSKRLALANRFLELFPVERVRAVRAVFTLPKRK